MESEFRMRKEAIRAVICAALKFRSLLSARLPRARTGGVHETQTPDFRPSVVANVFLQGLLPRNADDTHGQQPRGGCWSPWVGLRWSNTHADLLSFGPYMWQTSPVICLQCSSERTVCAVARCAQSSCYVTATQSVLEILNWHWYWNLSSLPSLLYSPGIYDNSG